MPTQYSGTSITVYVQMSVNTRVIDRMLFILKTTLPFWFPFRKFVVNKLIPWAVNRLIKVYTG